MRFAVFLDTRVFGGGGGQSSGCDRLQCLMCFFWVEGVGGPLRTWDLKNRVQGFELRV